MIAGLASVRTADLGPRAPDDGDWAWFVTEFVCEEKRYPTTDERIAFGRAMAGAGIDSVGDYRCDDCGAHKALRGSCPRCGGTCTRGKATNPRPWPVTGRDRPGCIHASADSRRICEGCNFSRMSLGIYRTNQGDYYKGTNFVA